MAFVKRVSFWTTLSRIIGLSTLIATLALSFSGGILYLLLQAPGGVGYIMGRASSPSF